MNKYIYYYKIADLILEITTPFKVRQEEPYSHYLLSDKPDTKQTIVSISFVVDDKLDYENFELIYEGNILVFQSKSSFYLGLMKENGIPISLLEQKNIDGQCEYVCHVLKSSEWEFHYVRQLIEAVSLEYIFMLNSIHMLHASHISYQGKSILFTAPSGTGKSTQAELWRMYSGADVINGDRVAIKKAVQGWKTYGVPFCGSSGISVNRELPLGAIVVLRQGKENTVEKLDKRTAFLYLYSEMIVHIWNIKYQQKCIDWLLELLEEIPVYILRCKPDIEAVEVLRKQLEEDNLWTN